MPISRTRPRRTNDKCEGRKSYSEAKPELVALAKQLRRELPRPSLRDISDALFARGYATPLGKPYLSIKQQTTSKADPPDSALKVVCPLPMPFDRTVT